MHFYQRFLSWLYQIGPERREGRNPVSWARMRYGIKGGLEHLNMREMVGRSAAPDMRPELTPTAVHMRRSFLTKKSQQKGSDVNIKNAS
jgi:hypothetical protein